MSSKPNILFVMTDHTNSQAIAPASQCFTPNLDSLAGEGTRFSRCYTTNAICSPARASLMTGLYPSAHGMWDCTHTQRREWVDVPKERFTYFSQILSDAGYKNAYFGKWHVEQSCKLDDFGWHIYTEKCQARKRSQNEELENRVEVKTEGYADYPLAGVDAGDTPQTHPAFDAGIDFIRAHLASGESEKPFCCFVSTTEPHDPYIPPKKFYDLYDPDSIALPESFRDEGANKPEVVRRMQSVWKGLDEGDWRRMCACYWATISFLDHEFGRLVAELKAQGIYDNTIIVFTSDHGDMLASHGLVAKGVGTAYEEVYNTPFVMRVPSAAMRGEDQSTVVSIIDIAPTLLDYCGAEPLPECHGRSLRAVFENGEKPDGWSEAYAEFFGQRFVYTQRMVWNEEWKYVFSPGGVDELYNLEKDPDEMNNLAQNSQYREVLVDMAKRMWRKMREIGDESLFNSNYATLRTAPVGPQSIE